MSDLKNKSIKWKSERSKPSGLAWWTPLANPFYPTATILGTPQGTSGRIVRMPRSEPSLSGTFPPPTESHKSQIYLTPPTTPTFLVWTTKDQQLPRPVHLNRRQLQGESLTPLKSYKSQQAADRSTPTLR
jgi:hypothetical protein